MLGHIAGCIPTANIHDMSQTLFRATRGNMLLKHEEITAPIMDPTKPDEAVQKSVFVIFFSGDRSRVKIDKICDSYAATKYRLPEQVRRRPFSFAPLASVPLLLCSSRSVFPVLLSLLSSCASLPPCPFSRSPFLLFQPPCGSLLNLSLCSPDAFLVPARSAGSAAGRDREAGGRPPQGPHHGARQDQGLPPREA